jgi:hypothetical protein
LASRYNLSATVIMLRARTVTQNAADATFTLQNRLLGESNNSDPSHGLSLNSSIVHHFYRTPSYGLGSIFFNPAKENATFGAPPQVSLRSSGSVQYAVFSWYRCFPLYNK